ncbi:MAG: helix-turn-helix domain-containing protein [Proteobacteria bacterium]|nr:helix-turn-helix domain-containing protein [Pseudomonadota bacterium]MCK4868556.1 helix-turn-helix domain-containing protein [Alphaproteobacteria bacterium]
MSKEVFEGIKAGLEEALAHMRGEETGAVVHTVMVPVVDVRAVRKKLGMSQDVFARQFGVSAATVRNWEQGRRRPEGPARVLLRVIDKEPEAVKRALAG